MNIQDHHHQLQSDQGVGGVPGGLGMDHLDSLRQPSMMSSVPPPTSDYAPQPDLPLPVIPGKFDEHQHLQVVGKKRPLDGSMVEGQPLKKKRKKGKKRPRDPNAPKRPQTAYLIFYRSNVSTCVKLPEFVNKNGNVDMTKVSKYLGQKWKELDPEKKKGYRDQYEKQKEKYEEELNQYNLRKKYDLQAAASKQAPGEQDLSMPPSMAEMSQPSHQQLGMQLQTQHSHSHLNPDTMNYDDVLQEWKSLKVEKQHMIARLTFLRQSFDKFRGNFKNLTSDLNYLLEYLK